jgi:uncharacterized protein
METGTTAQRVRRALEATDPGLAVKFSALLGVLRRCGSACIGYSGGADSVLLAQAAMLALGPDRVLGVTGLSPSVPLQQREIARSCARQMGLPHLEVETAELADPAYAANPTDRCYYCKRELWSKLQAVADARGLECVLDGSNADDVLDHRPGMRAGHENSVRTPLLEAGLTKADIRELSRRFGLTTWDQPAAPCLASRLPYGLAVTPARLRQVELAEASLRELGFRELRVRHHGDVARLELGPAELAAVADHTTAIAVRLRAAGFQRVLLDVEGYRRGALNESLTQLQAGRA